MREASFAAKMVRGVQVVTAPAEVDVGNAALMRTALLRASAGGRGAIILDMTATQLCDSAGLSVLIRCHRRAVAQGGSIRVVTSAPQLRRMMDVTGLDQLLQHFPTLEDALEPVGQVPQTTTVGGSGESPARHLRIARNLP